LDIFVANCTQQAYIFHFRIPESPSPWQVTIPQGGQVKLPAPPGGFNTQQADSVISQLVRAGGASVADARVSRKRVWLMWSEKQHLTHKMYEVIEQNQKLLQLDGERLRREAAIAIDSVVDSLGDVHRFQSPDAIEVSVVEEESKNNPSPSFAEGLRVSKSEPPGATPPRGRRGNRRAA
jgi:hypothetical protein